MAAAQVVSTPTASAGGAKGERLMNNKRKDNIRQLCTATWVLAPALPSAPQTARLSLPQCTTLKELHRSCVKASMPSRPSPGQVPRGSPGTQSPALLVAQASANDNAAVPTATAPPTSEAIEAWNEEFLSLRRQQLEDQALDVLRKTVEGFSRPAFPCALIAGDVVILHLLHRLGALQDGRVKVIFIDTFHLFPETYAFLSECEERYGFKSHVFHAAGVSTKQEYQEVHGSDLFIRDIDEYDRVCKVEPFGRALTSLRVDAMINGRRRDHGAERAHLEVFETAGGGDMAKVQPLAYWEFRDCFAYLERHGVPGHPLHKDGFPSIGDVQTTLPVPRERWFEYGGERSGRFQGLRNRDGSDKTECGIHVGDARGAASSSDLSAPSSSLTPPSSPITFPSSSPVTPPASSLRPPPSS